MQSRRNSFQLIGPFGHFSLSHNDWRPAICIAGGTGLAPILSVLDQALAAGDKRSITLLYGARTQDELYSLGRLKSWARGSFEFVPVLSHEPSDSPWEGARGLVTDALAQRLSDVFGLEAYVCGPPAMIDAAVSVLSGAGVASEDIRIDRFAQAKF